MSQLPALLDCAAAWDRMSPAMQRQLGIAALIAGIASVAMDQGTTDAISGRDLARWIVPAQEEAGFLLANLAGTVLPTGGDGSAVPVRPDLACIDVTACRVCGCTEALGCAEGCSWASMDPPVCTVCAEAADEAARSESTPEPAPEEGSLAWFEALAFMPGHPGSPKLPYQRRVTEELQGLADGKWDKLLLMAPFDHTTIELVTTELFILWCMARRRTRVLLVGPQDATCRSRQGLKQTLAQHGAVIEVQAVPSKRLDTLTLSNGSTLQTVSIAASLMSGRQYDLIIFNRPYTPLEASSSATRSRLWDAFNEISLKTTGDSKVVFLGQPFHKTDLVSWIELTPGWRVVRMPAAANRSNDALGRVSGELLWPGNVSLEEFIQRNTGPFPQSGVAPRDMAIGLLQLAPFL